MPSYARTQGTQKAIRQKARELERQNLKLKRKRERAMKKKLDKVKGSVLSLKDMIKHHNQQMKKFAKSRGVKLKTWKIKWRKKSKSKRVSINTG